MDIPSPKWSGQPKHLPTPMLYKSNLRNISCGIWGINRLYIALMSLKYNIVSIYAFMSPCQHHIRARNLVLIVLIFHFNLSIIHVAVMRYMLTIGIDPLVQWVSTTNLLPVYIVITYLQGTYTPRSIYALVAVTAM